MSLPFAHLTQRRLVRTDECSRPDRYGSSANLVLTTGHGVNGYTLDAALGEFILTHPDVRILRTYHYESVFADCRGVMHM